MNCVNDAPIANNDATATGAEDTPFLLSVTVNDTDLDHATGSLTLTGLTQPGTGALLSLSGVNILATPSLNYCALTPETFTYQIQDASGATSNIATGSFVITCVNDAPIAIDDTASTNRNANVTIDVLSNDTDTDHVNADLSINSVTTGSLGTPTIVGTGILFTPTPALCGTGTFTYDTVDASGSVSNTATGTIIISCTNSNPTANDDSLTIAEDAAATTLDIIANDTDPDGGDTLSISGII